MQNISRSLVQDGEAQSRQAHPPCRTVPQLAHSSVPNSQSLNFYRPHHHQDQGRSKAAPRARELR